MTDLIARRKEIADWALIGLFLLALFSAMRSAAELMAPMVAALIFGTLLSRAIDRLAKFGLPPLVSAIGLLSVIGLAILLFISALMNPLASFAARAPEMLRQLVATLTPLAQPYLSAQQSLSELVGGQNGGSMLVDKGVSGVTALLGGAAPALGEFGVFFVTMTFFVAGRQALRRKMILSWSRREQRMSTLRVLNDVEEALGMYFGAAATIYAGVGVATTLIAWTFGLPRPMLWGVFTCLASFVPYFGAASVVVALAAGGIAAHHQIGLGLLPAIVFIGVHLVSENAVIPSLLGRRLEINPFVVFVSIVFWGWMWGAVGAVLAVPILLVFDTVRHEFRQPEPELP